MFSSAGNYPTFVISTFDLSPSRHALTMRFTDSVEIEDSVSVSIVIVYITLLLDRVAINNARHPLTSTITCMIMYPHRLSLSCIRGFF